jgi:hypothetical protein
MTTTDGAATDGVARRAAAILLRPRRTWARIAAEQTRVRAIFVGYVMVLGAINPICFTIGRLVFGERVLGAVYRPPVIAAVIEALISYLLILAFVFALAFFIWFFARLFGASRDRLAVFKVAAYAGTGGWAASVFYLVPVIQPLAIVGQLYTLYLLYSGVRIVLHPPGKRTLSYVALVVVCYVVLMMLVISLTKLLAALL